MKTLTVKSFENINVYNNENIQRILGSVINESSNAALVSVFEDEVIIYDHEKARFFKSAYTIDRKNHRVILENFEEIQVVEEEDDITESIKDYFEDEISTTDLLKSYAKTLSSQKKVIAETISDAMSKKSFLAEDYTELAYVDRNEDLLKESFVQFYADRVKDYPLNKINYFNFKDDVIISLVPTEKRKIYNSFSKENALNLWKSGSFKSSLKEGVMEFLKYEDASALFEALKNYPSFFFLDRADRKTVVGKSLLMESDLRQYSNSVSSEIEKLISEGTFDEVKALLNEEEAPEEDDTTEKKPLEMTPDQIDKVGKEVKAIASKVEDEKLSEKLMALGDKLCSSKEAGVPTEEMKEAVSILVGRNIYEYNPL